MSIIQVLSENVRNIIAAGEVVERPASVVKELVENSIDAGATDISVEVVAGGLNKIIVTDDGSGMDKGDLMLSIERHATSKLRDENDLEKIATMGFRGEALPSIASVSKMTIESKLVSTDHLPGHTLNIEGGNIGLLQEKGMNSGTKITVEDLFYNVPARKKFARTARTELGHIKDMIQRLALANPQIRFQLISDGKQVVSAHTLNNDEQRASEILGSKLVRESYQCDEGTEEIRVHGLVGDPSVANGKSGGLYWFVNKRPIKDRLLNHAVNEAYRSLLPHGYYPFSLLFISVPPDMVDVNVHPAKSEVKFLKGNAVHDFVVKAVRKTLTTLKVDAIGTSLRAHPPEAEGRGNLPVHTTGVINAIERFYESDKNIEKPTRKDYKTPIQNELIEAGKFSSLKIVGQLHHSFILCENYKGALVIIDQHAAHERIGYERLKEGYAKANVPSQRLLLPDVVEVSAKTVGYLEKALPELNKIGWEIDFFGGDNFCVKAVPAIFGNVNLRVVLQSLAEDLSLYGKIDSFDEKLDYLMKVNACHAQVRAGDKLEISEIRALLKDMDKFELSDRCPHGRPAVFEISLSEIEKKFNRT